MATSRLTFLYPHLCRTGRWTEPVAVSAAAAHQAHRRSPTATSLGCSHQTVALFTTPSVGRQAPFPKRHGKAVEPVPLPALESHEPPPPEPSKPAEQTPQGAKGAAQQEQKPGTASKA